MPAEFWQLMLALVSVLSIIVGARVYAWKRSADAQLETVRADAQEAMDRASQIKLLADSVREMAGTLSRMIDRGEGERREWTRIIETNAGAKEQLALAVQAQTGSITQLRDEVVKGRTQAVDAVKQHVDTVTREELTRLEQIEAKLKTILAETQAVKAMVAAMAAPEPAPPPPALEVEKKADVPPDSAAA